MPYYNYSVHITNVYHLYCKRDYTQKLFNMIYGVAIDSAALLHIISDYFTLFFFFTPTQIKYILTMPIAVFNSQSFERHIKSMIKHSNVLECCNLLLFNQNTETVMRFSGEQIFRRHRSCALEKNESNAVSVI